MSISGKTRVVGIFGDPIDHTLSPRMQNAALQAAGIDAAYLPFHVTPGQLPGAVAAIRALGLVGVNLTIPHKEVACRLVDELDEAAELAGAVNTIACRDGRLYGFNTDGTGLLAALREEFGLTVQGRRVLIIGAGGASRGALVALALAGAAWIGVANRTLSRAEKLVQELTPRLQGTSLAAFSLDDNLTANLGVPVDLLINSTSAGLSGDQLSLPIAGLLVDNGAVYDMVYGAEPTALVRAALAAGIPAADGRSMLVGQGEAAFRLWFGVAAPTGVMRNAIGLLR